MATMWNRGGCNGQCAGYDGVTQSNGDARYCGDHGMNAPAQAGTNAGQNGCTCGNTAANSSRRCCDNCGLTINPDGSQLVARGTSRQGNSTGTPCRTCGCQSQCACGEQSASPCTSANGCQPCPCGRSCHQAVVPPQAQQMGETYAAEEALFQGTLFPELDKPMAAVETCPTENCATRRQLTAFELWELRLYLDTHPEDGRALQRWQQLCSSGCEDNYATAFTGNCAQGGCWAWAQAPWPWEYQPCRSCGCSN